MISDDADAGGWAAEEEDLSSLDGGIAAVGEVGEELREARQ